MSALVKEFGIKNDSSEKSYENYAAKLVPQSAKNLQYQLDLVGVACVAYEMLTEEVFDFDGHQSLKLV
jgi:hypothetical protein